MSGAYSSEINTAASKYGVPASLVKAVATQESSLGQASQNVMQVNGMDTSSPQQSIDVGTKMLGEYYKQTGGNIGWTLAMYNMGPGIYNWAQQHGYTDPAVAMEQFAKHMGGNYGDPSYITHVTRYIEG